MIRGGGQEQGCAPAPRTWPAIAGLWRGRRACATGLAAEAERLEALRDRHQAERCFAASRPMRHLRGQARALAEYSRLCDAGAQSRDGADRLRSGGALRCPPARPARRARSSARMCSTPWASSPRWREGVLRVSFGVDDHRRATCVRFCGSVRKRGSTPYISGRRAQPEAPPVFHVINPRPLKP